MEVELPNAFEPRPYQRNLMRYLDNGGKRAVVVWHRRSGKDIGMMHQEAKAAHMLLAEAEVEIMQGMIGE